MFGIDLVDLQHVRPGKLENRRFLELVFGEDHIPELSEEPEVWMYWTAKEAVFKTLEYSRPGNYFVPAKVPVSLDPEIGPYTFIRHFYMPITGFSSGHITGMIYGWANLMISVCAEKNYRWKNPFFELWLKEESAEENILSALKKKYDHDFVMSHTPQGLPTLTALSSLTRKYHLSISHHGDYYMLLADEI